MNKDLKNKLTPMQYYVTQEKGTEEAFSGDLWNNFKEGDYLCVVCGEKLFVSDNKFESGCGWPSFDKPVIEAHVKENLDNSFGMIRKEVICSKCGAHLGHVFDDGPKQTTGLRYCINSASLLFNQKS